MSGWNAVLVVGDGALAHCEVCRFGLTAFLPRRKTLIRVKSQVEPLTRMVPIIPRAVLMPAAQSRHRGIPYCRGIRRLRWLAEGADGKVLVIPSEAIKALADCEREFDAPLSGNLARLSRHQLMAAVLGEEVAAVFAPLFAPLTTAATAA
jgi:hypothetical protein